MKRQGRSFFSNQAAPELAQALLGCTLVHQSADGKVGGLIYETEAYTETDEASHTFGGKKTKRNEVMFTAGGHLYVYFTYGKHHCLNIVSDRKGVGSAVLVRALKLTEGVELARARRYNTSRRSLVEADIANGPGKLCQALGINKEHNGFDLTDSNSSIYILPATDRLKSVEQTSRVGISRGRDTQWRFVVKL